MKLPGAMSLADYESFRRTRRWYEMRVRVFERDKNRCQACLQTKRSFQLDMHHLTYRYGLDAPFFALVTLCRDCHGRLHASKRGLVDPWDPASRKNINLSAEDIIADGTNSPSIEPG